MVSLLLLAPLLLRKGHPSVPKSSIAAGACLPGSEPMGKVRSSLSPSGPAGHRMRRAPGRQQLLEQHLYLGVAFMHIHNMSGARGVAVCSRSPSPASSAGGGFPPCRNELRRHRVPLPRRELHWEFQPLQPVHRLRGCFGRNELQ